MDARLTEAVAPETVPTAGKPGSAMTPIPGVVADVASAEEHRLGHSRPSLRPSVVVTTLTTPSGTPASVTRRATASAVSGVSAAGLSTTVHPAAILRVAIAAGKFHGVTRAATPTGQCVTSVRTPPAGASPYSPPGRTASSANHRKNSAA